jgi:hypothetical protein
MTKCAKFVACVGVLCLGVASRALAEPITVTAGSLVFPTGERFQAGVLSLTGTLGVLGASQSPVRLCRDAGA